MAFNSVTLIFLVIFFFINQKLGMEFLIFPTGLYVLNPLFLLRAFQCSFNPLIHSKTNVTAAVMWNTA